MNTSRLLLGLLCAIVVCKAQATQFVVTNPNDETTPGNGCSIREAVENTDNGFLASNTPHPDCPVGSAPDLIEFDDSIGTIALNAPLLMTGSVTINGGGHVTLDGQGSTQIVIATPAFGSGNILQRIRLERGYSVGNGGCILNSSILNLTEVTLSQCYAALNGGALATTSTALLVRSTVDDNEANPAAPTAGAGGGVFGNNGQVRLTDTTISNNRARVGGGVYVNVGAYTFNATLAYNQATQTGGGLTYSNGNTANRIYLRFSTFVGNSAGTNGSALHAAGAINLYQSLIAANTGAANCYISGASGLISDGNYNLDDGSSCGFGASGSINNANMSGLGPLQDNGGPTLTFSSAFTPATDAAACDLTNVPKDQRGATRPFGSQCDIGAYEYVKYNLTYQTNGAGSLDVGGSLVGMWSENHDFGEDGSTILAVPFAGYRFLDWSDGVTDNPRTDTAIRADINVTANFAPWLILPNTGMPDGTYDEVYPTQQFSVVGGVAPITYGVLTGTLPPGLTLDTQGKLSGTPTMSGTYSFVVSFTDAASVQLTESYEITIHKASQNIDFDPGDWDVYLDPGDTFDLAPHATVDTGLPLTYYLDNPQDGVCSLDGSVLTMLDEGYCDFSIDQPGNSNYLPENYSDSLYFIRATIFADGLEAVP